MHDPTWLLGYTKTTFTHHENTKTLPTKTGSKTTLSKLVSEATPPCHLNPLLFNGHLQTIYTVLKDPGPEIYYKRRVFQSEHSIYQGEFVVDFVVSKDLGQEPSKHESLPERTTYYSAQELEAMGSDDDKPMLVCLHGLTGGSHENYLRQVVAPVTAQGWECCVVTARGCGFSKITTQYPFNARATWDVRQIVKYLRKTFPNRPLYGVGFSLGANILTNYVGEEGAKCELKAAIAVSSPWNLEISHHNLQGSWFGREVYYRALGKSTKAFYERHREQILKTEGTSDEEIMGGTYLSDFDRAVQCPVWGYPTIGAYYRDASSVDAVTNIRIPFIGLSAEDDPISALEAIPFDEFRQNPYTVLVTTNWGGHLGWFSLGGKRWFGDAVAKMLFKLQDDVDFSASSERTRSNEEVVVVDKSHGWDGARRRMKIPL